MKNVKTKLLKHIEENHLRIVDIFTDIMISDEDSISYSTLWNTIHGYNSHAPTHKTKDTIAKAIGEPIDNLF